MKDIYSPLEIDEEWDQRAPDMSGEEGAGTTVAVESAPGTQMADMSAEPSPNIGSSTLPPTETETNPATSQMDSTSSGGDMMHDPAHDAAEMVVNQPNSATGATEPNPSDQTLEIGNITSDEETRDTVNNFEDKDAEPTKVNVMGDSDVDEPVTEGPAAGSVIEPQVKPDGMEDVMPEPEVAEPEAKEDEEPELPSSPVAEVEDAHDEEPKVTEMDESEMDSTDKRFMAELDRWNEAKRRAAENLNKLKADVRAEIDQMNGEISVLQDRVSKKEEELDGIEGKIAEVGEVKEAA